MSTLGYCLEEYVDYLKSYTSDTKLLHIKEDMTLEDIDSSSVAESGVQGGWLAYYVPMSEGESTDIPLLRGDAYSNYTLSGNNVDGFVVTVKLG